MEQKVARRPKESKFVSIFSDSEPDSDISFRDAAQGLLKQSAERYMVGVDNLTVSMDGFSMIDQTATPQVIIEVLRLQHSATDVAGNPATWLEFPSQFRHADPGSYQLRNDGPNITTYADMVIRLNEIAANVNRLLSSQFSNTQGTWSEFIEICTHAGGGTILVDPDDTEDDKHLQFNLDITGRLTIKGSRLFWITHMIHIPVKKYQHIFEGALWDAGIDQRILALTPWDSPDNGTRMGITDDPTANEATKLFALAEVNGVLRCYVKRWDDIDHGKFIAQVEGTAFYQYIRGASYDAQVWREIYSSFRYDGNIFSTFDRRICIEVGTSLPLQNSPLVEDNREANDYILGRFFINPAVRVNTNNEGARPEIAYHGPSVFTFMDGTQRVLYHHLHPQQKITTVRVKLYARIRTYDEAKDTWGMRVIALPTERTDWWHIRLHFKEIEA